jgi:hypothetical protein
MNNDTKNKEDSSYYQGILFALGSISKSCDSAQAAIDLVRNAGGLGRLRAVAEQSAHQYDQQTLEWLIDIGAE